tara:strand:+ start:1667 stop:2419 length:753 start_codon:yes stop_codon:yes gene_type:complete
MYKINIGSCEFELKDWLNLDRPSEHYSTRQHRIDYPHDLMSFRPIPIKDGQISIAYTSHTIEHISDRYVNHLFKEVYRILESGGTFRVTCPDIGKCYDAYMANDKKYIEKWLLNPQGWDAFRSLGIGEEFLFIFASYLSPYGIIDNPNIKRYNEREITEIFERKNKVEALTHFTDECQVYAERMQPTHPGHHISWWDFDKLKDLLESVGFKDVISREYNQSGVPELKDFDQCNVDNTKTLDYTLFLECAK